MTEAADQTAPILVLGATSGIGKCAVEEAVSRGHGVRAFSRSADAVAWPAGVEASAGDARQAEDVAQALDGAGAVIYALGIKERLAMLWEPETLFSETTGVLLKAMAAAGCRRLIVVTGFGAGRSRAAMSRVEALGHRALLGRPYDDKDRQEALVMESDLEWTIVRPVILTNGARTARYRVLEDPAQWRNGLIPRADVAHYLVEAAEQALHVRQDVVLAR